MRKKSILTGLAGAAALAGASQAYGTIIVRPVPANLTGHDPASTTNTSPQNRLIDVDGNGVNDLRLSYRSFNTGGFNIQQDFVYSLNGGGTAGYYNGGSQQWYAYKLASGDLIPGANSFGQSATYLTQVCTNVNGSDYAPYWYIGDRGFIGFSFKNTANVTLYGYIEVELDPYVSAANPGGLKFFSLAYDDSGAPIAAGAVPEPSTLAALAFGGIGLAAAAFRRRKKS